MRCAARSHPPRHDTTPRSVPRTCRSFRKVRRRPTTRYALRLKRSPSCGRPNFVRPEWSTRRSSPVALERPHDMTRHAPRGAVCTSGAAWATVARTRSSRSRSLFVLGAFSRSGLGGPHEDLPRTPIVRHDRSRRARCAWRASFRPDRGTAPAHTREGAASKACRSTPERGLLARRPDIPDGHGDAVLLPLPGRPGFMRSTSLVAFPCSASSNSVHASTNRS